MHPLDPPRALRNRPAHPRWVARVLASGLIAALATLVAAPKPWRDGALTRGASGDEMGTTDYLLTYGWFALAASAALLVGLLGTVRVWLRGEPVPRVESLAPPARRPGALWAALVLAAVVAGGILAAPRLGQSLWNDEIYSLQKSIDGSWTRTEGGDWSFERRSWMETLWRYRMPNNHVPHSVLARLTLEGWRALGGGREQRVDERVLRAPAFLAGAASIAAGALLLWRAGFPAAGIALAWLLALHPWAMRYASEARGYSMVLFLISAHAALLVHTLAHGRWARWLAYGGAQGLLLWLYPAAVQVVAITNVVALVALLTLHRGAPALPVQFARFVVVQLLSAGAWLQMMAPNLPQLAAYIEHGTSGLVGFRWVLDVAGYLFVGMPYKRPPTLGPHYPQLLDRARDAVPLAYLVGGAFALALVAAGVLRLARCGGVRALLALALLLPGPLTWLMAYLSGVFLWQWYLLFMLPAWGALAALGLTWPLSRARRAPARALGGALVAATLVAFAVASTPARHTMRSRSLQPRRESVLLTRPSLDPRAAGQDRVLTASFSVAPTHYDPAVAVVDQVSELRAEMERADREALPLYVNVGALVLGPQWAPELSELVQREELFEEVAVLHGFEPRLSRHVFRYRGELSGFAAPRAVD